MKRFIFEIKWHSAVLKDSFQVLIKPRPKNFAKFPSQKTGRKRGKPLELKWRFDIINSKKIKVLSFAPSLFIHSIKLGNTLNTKKTGKRIFLGLVPGLILGLFVTSASAQETRDNESYVKQQAEVDAPEMMFQRGQEVNNPNLRNFNPHMSGEINEPHPFPDYMKRFIKDGKFPQYYRELLLVPPVDKVQSKVFDADEIRKVRRIGVLDFENKTNSNLHNPGGIMAKQIYKELQAVNEYAVISPSKMQEMAFRLKIIKTPGREYQKFNQKQSDEINSMLASKLPFSEDQMDAVMIGAVTKYVSEYKDRRGEMQKSMSPGIEFGAFLVSTKTGKILWGSRYVGSQSYGLPSFFKPKHRSYRWMDKEEVSRIAMKKVVETLKTTRGGTK